MHHMRILTIQSMWNSSRASIVVNPHFQGILPIALVMWIVTWMLHEG